MKLSLIFFVTFLYDKSYFYYYFLLIIFINYFYNGNISKLICALCYSFINSIRQRFVLFPEGTLEAGYYIAPVYLIANYARTAWYLTQILGTHISLVSQRWIPPLWARLKEQPRIITPRIEYFENIHGSEKRTGGSAVAKGVDTHYAIP